MHKAFRYLGYYYSLQSFDHFCSLKYCWDTLRYLKICLYSRYLIILILDIQILKNKDQEQNRWLQTVHGFFFRNM